MHNPSQKAAAASSETAGHILSLPVHFLKTLNGEFHAAHCKLPCNSSLVNTTRPRVSWWQHHTQQCRGSHVREAFPPASSPADSPLVSFRSARAPRKPPPASLAAPAERRQPVRPRPPALGTPLLPLLHVADDAQPERGLPEDATTKGGHLPATDLSSPAS